MMMLTVAAFVVVIGIAQWRAMRGRV